MSGIILFRDLSNFRINMLSSKMSDFQNLPRNIIDIFLDITLRSPIILVANNTFSLQMNQLKLFPIAKG